MAAKSRRGAPATPDNEERWLLTYSDMITLLMALFMVLFSISSVNVSKYVILQQSLKAAFSGSILPGGRAILQSGSESTSVHTPATAAVPSIMPLTPNIPKPVDIGSAQAQAAVNAAQAVAPKQALGISAKMLQQALKAAQSASQEQADFRALEMRLNQYAQANGFAGQVKAQIERRGLVVTVLTDNLLFASGQATLKPQGAPLLNEIANLLNVDETHPIVIEGYTDDIPIDTAQFPSNWELSTTRATTVVQYLIAHGVDENRLGAAGYAQLHPLASNATAAGRSENRRVEIVFERLNPYSP
ncbi:MAG: OmpA family protein [Solirubrobacteraceae bacterium]|jgi:chemotaxis protein MotB